MALGQIYTFGPKQLEAENSKQNCTLPVDDWSEGETMI
jgi:hypothetical protein